MATFRGVAATGLGVLALLEEAWSREPFVNEALGTELVRAEDLKQRPFNFGVTVYVYRIAVNGTQRTIPPTIAGRRRPLPVEVDFVVTTWGPSAQRELELLGWCMRILDDEPILTTELLNRPVADQFTVGELVEIVPNPLPLDEYYRLWEVLPWDYQLSAAYTARMVRLESTRTVIEAPPVTERDLEFAALERDR
jgi:hypothetical protein